MAQTVKRLSSEYRIQTTAQNIYIDTEDYSTSTKATIYLNGNLVITGLTTEVEKNNLSVSDNVITVNAGETGAGVSSGTAGLEVDRGVLPSVDLRWNESVEKWQITTDGSNYSNIATAALGSYLTSVQEDLAPTLGGNLDVNGFSITSSGLDQNITLDVPVQLPQQATLPTVVPGSTLIYASLSNGGGTGLYVSSTEFAHQELVSKKKALAYALIF